MATCALVTQLIAVARAVAQLVQDDMPQLSFNSTLTSRHGDLRKMLPVLIR
jgi:hypothetical protein